MICILGLLPLAEAICMGEGWMGDLCLRTDTKTNAAGFSAGPVESFSNIPGFIGVSIMSLAVPRLECGVLRIAYHLTSFG